MRDVELPLISTSPTTSPDALVRAVKRSDTILARTGTDEQQLDVASVYACGDRPGIAAVNRAFDLRLPAADEQANGTDRPTLAVTAIDSIDACFTGGASCQIMDTNEPTWPSDLRDAIIARGFAAQTCTVHVLKGYKTPAETVALQIIPARAAYSEARALFAQQAAVLALPDDQRNTFADTCIDFLDEPRVDCFIARRDRQSVGHVSLLTLGNIGVLLDLFAVEGELESTLDALLSRMVDHCQRAQFEQVIARTTDSSAYRSFIEAKGFAPFVPYERFVK